MKNILTILPHSIAAWLLCVSAYAISDTRVPANHFMFTIDPKATVSHQSVSSSNDYAVALGKYKKSDNLWLPEKVQYTQGQLTRYTLELPRHYSEDQVFAFYRDQLPDTASPLFECESRACGESNNWANDHFGVKQLYGTNTSQRYAVFSIEGEQTMYVTLYVIRRGNRRLYAQLETVLSSELK